MDSYALSYKSSLSIFDNIIKLRIKFHKTNNKTWYLKKQFININTKSRLSLESV